MRYNFVYRTGPEFDTKLELPNHNRSLSAFRGYILTCSDLLARHPRINNRIENFHLLGINGDFTSSTRPPVVILGLRSIVVKSNARSIDRSKWCRGRSLNVASIRVHWYTLSDFGNSMISIDTRWASFGRARRLTCKAGFLFEASG